ncbi:hypothetical protein GTO89_12065 [Heliobacterium gestii]|uniref:Uncharacterized protein n=1 Tax=Heliomicrobium gestii TaxID=2699 RepID=A0A845LGR5_HELGE|nr:hypothetical protein [Heliomicrobium gestii]MBM7867224.1 hypothetical protein [Heliomicrobium gestii]MZP43779.1 hypothetical protein [Heliomicrobium gestii]
MRHFRVDLSLDEGNPREAPLIWWLDQLKEPGAVIRQVLLGNGMPPWIPSSQPAFFPLPLSAHSTKTVFGGEDAAPDGTDDEGTLAPLMASVSELNEANEEELDPETIKKGLQNVFG